MTVISQGGAGSRGRTGFFRRLRFATYGSGLGVIVIGVGIVLIALGWHGMAGRGGEINGVPNLNAQLPWLVSGGLLGLAFVVFGSAIIVAHNARVDRARLESKLDEMAAALDRSTAATQAKPTFTPEPREPRVIQPPAAQAAVEPNVVVKKTVAKKAAPAKKVGAKKAAPAKKTARATTSPRR